jgi:hypothetical protein
MSRARAVLVLALLAIAASSPGTAQAALGFTDPAALPKSLPGTGQLPGGEPSLAFDPTGDGHFYAVAPGGDGTLGVGFWGSADGGLTWPYVRAVGSAAGGGDSDVEAGIDHTVYILDLEVASSAVCRSEDFGKTFKDGCETGAAQNQAGAEEDRQWLSHDPVTAKTLYFNYHDFVGQYPIMEKSTDGGASFFPCGNLLDPSNQPGLFPAAVGNTIVGKSAVAKDHTIYVPIGAPTPNQAAQSIATGGIAGYGQIVVAFDKGCNNSQFKNKTVYSNDTGNFSNLFISNAVGPDGTVYVIASGQLTDKDGYNTYLWVSRDGAQTFSGPIKVNSADLKTNVMPAIAAGNQPGQVAIGWFGSQDAKDPNDKKGTWRYYAVTSTDFGQTRSQATITPNVFHYGDICTVGIMCSQTGGNRNLLDFSSIGVDPKSGCVTTVFPGDPFNAAGTARKDRKAAAAYIALENDGSCMANQAPASVPAQGGFGGTVQVQGARTSCRDQTAPVSTLGRRSRFTRRGVTLSGTSRDTGCGPNGAGQVARVDLAISRRIGKRCRWLQPSGRFGPASSCARKTFVTAKGSSKWSFTYHIKLPPGTYAVVPRAIDAVGNQETPVHGARKARRNHNRYLFTVR